MQEAIERVMTTYGLIANLSAEETTSLREAVTAHLKKQPETDTNKLAVEGLRFARDVAS